MNKNFRLIQCKLDNFLVIVVIDLEEVAAGEVRANLTF